MGEINVVPYIDVMLVLLIIFMITAPLLKEGVKVDLPDAGAKPIDADLLKNHEPLILTIDARGKMYLVLLRPLEDKLVMQQLHYADEVRDIGEIPVGDAELREPELKLAHQLVEQIGRETFNPDAYEDEVKKRIEEQVQRKIEGQQIQASPNEQRPAQVIDLMEALKASLAKQPAPPAKKPAKRVEAEAPAAAKAPKKSRGSKSSQ